VVCQGTVLVVSHLDNGFVVFAVIANSHLINLEMVVGWFQSEVQENDNGSICLVGHSKSGRNR
jgi:hypothetical protein